MNSSANANDQPIVVDGGVSLPAVPAEDPYRVLDELMAVVEALCPTWPEREPFVNGGKMLL